MHSWWRLCDHQFVLCVVNTGRLGKGTVSEVIIRREAPRII